MRREKIDREDDCLVTELHIWNIYTALLMTSGMTLPMPSYKQLLAYRVDELASIQVTGF